MSASEQLARSSNLECLPPNPEGARSTVASTTQPLTHPLHSLITTTIQLPPIHYTTYNHPALQLPVYTTTQQPTYSEYFILPETFYTVHHITPSRYLLPIIIILPFLGVTPKHHHPLHRDHQPHHLPSFLQPPPPTTQTRRA